MDTILFGTVPHGGTRTILLRLTTWGAEADRVIVQADISSIAYTIYEIKGRDWEAVTGHEGVAIAVASSVFDTLQNDSRWDEDSTGYNFRFTPSVASHPPFEKPNREYRVHIEFTPASGEPFIEPVQFRAL